MNEPGDFSQLQRLLKLKRYEQPPPRYFNEFSSQVLARIKAGEKGSVDEISTPFFQRWLDFLGGKPVIPAAVGGAFCALLVVGATMMNENSAETDLPWSTAGSLPPMVNNGASLLGVNHGTTATDVMMVSSTNPVVQMGGSLFDQIRHQTPATVGWQFGKPN